MDPNASSSGEAVAGANGAGVVSAAAAGAGGQLLISGDQQLVLSPEDAAQLLAQAGIQLGDNEQVIIGPGGLTTVPATSDGAAVVTSDGAAVVTSDAGSVVMAASQLPQTMEAVAAAGIPTTTAAEVAAAGTAGAVAGQPEFVNEAGLPMNEIDDGTVLYIDPNDPQAAAILQQAGLRLAEDGTVTSVAPTMAPAPATTTTAGAALPTTEVPISSISSAGEAVMTSAVAAAGVDMSVVEAGTEATAASTVDGGNKPGMVLPPLDIKNEVEKVLQQGMGGESLPSAAGVGAGVGVINQAPTESILPEPSSRIPDIMSSKDLIEPVAKQAVPAPAPIMPLAPAPASPTKQAQHQNVVQVNEDQQQVLYSVTGEDGKTQQYMMLCPKDMDQNLLIQTLVKQISSDPSTKGGKKTIRITQQKGAVNKLTGLPPGSRVVSSSNTTPAKPKPQPQPQAQQQQQPQPTVKATPKRTTYAPAAAAATPRTPVGPAAVQASPALVQQTPQPPTSINNDLFAATPNPTHPLKNLVDASEVFESVVPDLPLEPADGGTRVYVRCNYCTSFRSTLNGDTWETILNHILPVSREEIQSAFYGDLAKHFIRCLRIQVNGRQMIKSPTGKEIPQCEVILTHSLICRKTKREFIVSNPDANFVANLAKHIRLTQPGNSGRGNSLLCIFCNSPFTYEDYLRHIQPHLDAILSTLNCFAGAYCANFYDSTIRACHNCFVCQEQEPTDLRFLPCTKFSNDYNCNKKLQFAVECFREHYGDNGFMRLNTTTVARCSVCKNTQQVYCAVFHISTTIVGDDETQPQQDVDSQLAVCVNCQKQFINIVMKEQGFEERLKLFQLKNMEQLCSVLRVILNQATAICNQQKTLIYTVHENTTNPNSAVHVVKSAEITQIVPVTKMLALAEGEIVGSPCKSFFICDLCYFTVDLTSLVATEGERQKNDMLLSIVLEHLVPHTESLMNVITSTAVNNQMVNLKYEVTARNTEQIPNQSKIVLSLQKKFRSANRSFEIMLDKDEDKTMSQLRAGAKTEHRKPTSYVTAKATKISSVGSDAATAGQMLEVNRFIDKQKGRLSILAQTGCNTTLLNAYTECRLCSKFSFPDFRLSGASVVGSSGSSATKSIDLCENCVETVLTLCLPTEPECLQEADECLALGEARLVGHRLVLSNNLKKWLSLDGVNLIKKTVDEFDSSKMNDACNVFQQSLKRHLSAALKACQRDDNIAHATAGFCVNDSLQQGDEAAKALASLQQGGGVAAGAPPPKDDRLEVQVTILSRKSARKTPRGPRKITSNGSIINLGGGGPGTPANGQKKKLKVIDLGPQSAPAAAVQPLGITATDEGTAATIAATPSLTVTASSSKLPVSTPRRPAAPAAATAAASTPQAADAPAAAESSTSTAPDDVQEESVSAIQSFLDETSSPEKASAPSPSTPTEAAAATSGEDSVKIPSGIKITAAGKGVVNIRAVADASRTPTSSKASSAARIPVKASSPTRAKPQPAAKSSGPSSAAATAAAAEKLKSMPGVSMVTLTANGVIRRVQQPQPQPREEEEDDDEEEEDDDSEDLGEDEEDLGEEDEEEMEDEEEEDLDEDMDEEEDEDLDDEGEVEKAPSPKKRKITATPPASASKAKPAPASKSAGAAAAKAAAAKAAAAAAAAASSSDDADYKPSSPAKSPSKNAPVDDDSTPTRSRRQRKEKKIFDL